MGNILYLFVILAVSSTTMINVRDFVRAGSLRFTLHCSHWGSCHPNCAPRHCDSMTCSGFGDASTYSMRLKSAAHRQTFFWGTWVTVMRLSNAARYMDVLSLRV